MKLDRNGIELEVMGKVCNGWDFWQAFAEGSWEPLTLREIEAIPPDSLLFDIGAWVGPISLWAAKHGVRCIAVEPDPRAYDDLIANIALNHFAHMITPVAAALAPVPGLVTLHSDGGNSSSGLTREVGEEISVMGATMEDLVGWYGQPDFLKMDIEGGESLVLPVVGPYLRERHIPMILSLHEHWFAPGSQEAFAAELAQWTGRPVERDTAVYVA